MATPAPSLRPAHLVLTLGLLSACAEGTAAIGGDGGAPPADAPAGEASVDPCAAALAAASFSFDADEGGWSHGVADGLVPSATWPHDPWEFGVAGVGTACSSGKCFGASLSQNYAMCQRGDLTSPTLDLAACQGRAVALTFRHAYSFWSEASFFDGGIVEVSGDDGVTWTLAESSSYPGKVTIKTTGTKVLCDDAAPFHVNGQRGFVGKQPAMTSAELTLPASAVSAKTRLRFSFGSGVSYDIKTGPPADPTPSRAGTGFGWRIDDVAFVAK